MTRDAELELADHLGDHCLAYLLCTDEVMLRRRLNDPKGAIFNAERETVLRALLTTDGGLPREPAELVAMNWSSLLGQIVDHGGTQSVGHAFHVESGGHAEPADAGASALESALQELADAAYPAFLVKGVFERHGFLFPHLHGHTSKTRFEELVRVDPELNALFDEESWATGAVGWLTRSIGQGGTVQLSTLAGRLLSAAWIDVRLDEQVPSLRSFRLAAMRTLGTFRSSLRGDPTTIRARIGITGVLLPDERDGLDLGWGRLRKADERDAAFIKAGGYEGQLSGVGDDGVEVIIKDGGDLVLEMDVPFLMAAGRTDLDSPWPESMKSSTRLVERGVENLMLGLALSNLAQVGVVSTWYVFADPLNLGPVNSMRDLAYSVRQVLKKLNLDEADAWAIWSQIVGEKRVASIDVAIRRMNAALAERRNVEDILVDAVIVWENLFGAKTETLLRVTASMARMLGTSETERHSLHKKYKDIYGFRSHLVHGAAKIDATRLSNFSQEAVQISKLALRAIFTTHQHLLEKTSSEERSIAVLLGQGD